MKKMGILTTLLLAGVLAGCASPYPMGMAYTRMNLPLSATSNSGPSVKVGSAECTSILSLFATGDCSIEAAKKNGGITKVNHVDWDAKNILGVYGEFKTIVYGE